MSLLTVSPYEIRQFLQILVWIAIPAILLSFITVTIVHYYRKKKLRNRPLVADHLFEISPRSGMNPNSAITGLQEAGYASMIQENMHQEEFREERYQRLKIQFSALYKKYVEVLARSDDRQNSEGDGMVTALQERLREYESRISRLQDELENIKNSYMENPDRAEWQDQFDQKEIEMRQLNLLVSQLREDARIEREQKESLSEELAQLKSQLESLESSATASSQESGSWNQSLQEQLYEAGKRYDTEKGQWMQQFQEVCTELQLLKEENLALGLRINDAERSNRIEPFALNEFRETAVASAQDIEGLEEERNMLRDKVFELEYLQDVVEEKKAQIEFIQAQLDQRIRSYHQLEQLHRAGTLDLNAMRETTLLLEQQLQAMQADLLQQQNETDRLYAALDEVAEEREKLREVAEEKMMYLEQLERKNQEWQEQHLHRLELLNSKETAIAELNALLQAQGEKISVLEAKLQERNKLLTNIYNELEKTVHSGETGPKSESASYQLENKPELVPQSDRTTPSEFRLSIVS